MIRIILRALNGPILVILLAIGIALQSSLFHSWPLHYFQPDLVLIVVLWCALKRGFEEGGIITLILANISEAHSSVPQGIFLINYMTIYLLMRASSRLILVPTLFSFAFITACASILWKITAWFVLYLLGSTLASGKHALTATILGAFIEGIFAFVFYGWFEKFDWMTFKSIRPEHALEEELQYRYDEGV